MCGNGVLTLAGLFITVPALQHIKVWRIEVLDMQNIKVMRDKNCCSIWSTFHTIKVQLNNMICWNEFIFPSTFSLRIFFFNSSNPWISWKYLEYFFYTVKFEILMKFAVCTYTFIFEEHFKLLFVLLRSILFVFVKFRYTWTACYVTRENTWTSVM